MSWQQHVFDRLKDREWHTLGDLFEQVELQIPIHIAMRYAMQSKKFDELPVPMHARWMLFKSTIALIGIEDECAKRQPRTCSTRVRLRYRANQSCAHCGGSVIRASWRSNTVVCLACESAPAEAIPKYETVSYLTPAPPEDKYATVAHLEQPSTGGVLEIHATPGWWYRARRAFAAFIRIRLPFLSPTKIAKELERCGGNADKVLKRYGKNPLTPIEFTVWVLSYLQQHPPLGIRPP
jgi:hypothetical protein